MNRSARMSLASKRGVISFHTNVFSGIGCLHSGPPEDEVVVLCRDLAHGLPEVAAPHRFVRDECKILDQGLELKGFGEDCDRFDLHAEGEDLVAHLRRGGKEAGVVLVGFGDDFVGSGYR